VSINLSDILKDLDVRLKGVIESFVAVQLFGMKMWLECVLGAMTDARKELHAYDVTLKTPNARARAPNRLHFPSTPFCSANECY
jgi:hypothetical protein